MITFNCVVSFHIDVDDHHHDDDDDDDELFLCTRKSGIHEKSWQEHCSS